MGRTAEAVAEGVAIATAAVRLVVRNHILMEVIAHDGTFEAGRIAPFVRETLRALADEQTVAADLARTQLRAAWGRHTESDGTHDYRNRDAGNLRRRRRQYLRVATALRALADDPAYIARVTEQARDAAWGDIAQNVERRLDVEGMTPRADPDYFRMRDARLQSFRLIDLPRLASEARARRRSSRRQDAVDGEGPFAAP